MDAKQPSTWDVVVEGWLSQDVAEQFAYSLGKAVALPGLRVRVFKHDGLKA